MRSCNGWRRLLLLLSLIFLLPLLFSVSRLHQDPAGEVSQVRTKTNETKHTSLKFDHLVFGPAAGQGLQNRLQCQGIKALNKIHSTQFHVHPYEESTAFITVFSMYNFSSTRNAYGKTVDLVTIGNSRYTKLERSMAILDTFVNFIQLSMPRSNIFILSDPASNFHIDREGVKSYPIQGDYSRDRLMLQRIRSYIAFLESREAEHSKRGDMQTIHYIFTDTDIAVVGDLHQIFVEHTSFDLALTFRNNKDQPLNSGFIAVRGTTDGIQRAKSFLLEVLEAYQTRFMRASRMLGDQLALVWVVKTHKSFDFRQFSRPSAFTDNIKGASVLFLPCATYNWTPPEGAGQFHGMPLDVKVVHFKGSRKRLMLEAWNFYNSTSNMEDMLCLILASGRTNSATTSRQKTILVVFPLFLLALLGVVQVKWWRKSL